MLPFPKVKDVIFALFRADVYDKKIHSYNMSQIKARNTKPEMLVRKFLKTLKALCSVLTFFKDCNNFYIRTEQGAKQFFVKWRSLIGVLRIPSAFFFVFHKNSTSLTKANEKDSASMNYK